MSNATLSKAWSGKKNEAKNSLSNTEVKVKVKVKVNVNIKSKSNSKFAKEIQSNRNLIKNKYT